METPYPVEWPQFYTATIIHWKHLLSENRFKDIIISSLRFLVENKRIELNGFVIMSNHIHLIWQSRVGYTYSENKSAFMKFTGAQLKILLQKEDPVFLNEFKVNKYDRSFQIWKRESLSVELFTQEVFLQKLDYIHNNPFQAGLCVRPEDYYYSSAKFYETGVDYFGILTHYMGS